MATQATVLTDPKQSYRDRFLVGGMLGGIGLFLLHVFIFSPELHVVPLMYPCISLAMLFIMSAATALLGGLSTIRWPARLMLGLSVFFLVVFLGTFAWWLIAAKLSR